jgi:hypothetical protein
MQKCEGDARYPSRKGQRIEVLPEIIQIYVTVAALVEDSQAVDRSGRIRGNGKRLRSRKAIHDRYDPAQGREARTVNGVARITAAHGIANSVAAVHRIADCGVRAGFEIEGIALGVTLRKARRAAGIAGARVAVRAEAGVELIARRVALRMALRPTGFTQAQVIARRRSVRIATTRTALAEVEAIAAGPGTGILLLACLGAGLADARITAAEIETFQ